VESPTFELGTDGPLRILVGVDGSDTSLRAAAYAAGLARRQGATLIVLYVKQPPVAPIMQPAAIAGIRASHDEFAADLGRQLEEGSDRLGINAELVVREGSPYGQLVKVAEERKVDAIVIGASMHAGHRVVGSLAGKLVRHAIWPVTVIP
jgi:nucleotide-binding universal stress UspA family protein